MGVWRGGNKVQRLEEMYTATKITAGLGYMCAVGRFPRWCYVHAHSVRVCTGLGSGAYLKR